MRKIAIIGGDAIRAAAIAAALLNTGAMPVVMEPRRPEFEPCYDMNDLIDLEGKAERKADRKSRLKAAQTKAFGGKP